jgi:hypothetical protein
MIDIGIHPSDLQEAKRDIKDMIRRYNKYNEYDMIELRNCDGTFLPEYAWLYVIDNTDRTDGEYFIRLEFDDDYKIKDAVVDHFGEFNVGY